MSLATCSSRKSLTVLESGASMFSIKALVQPKAAAYCHVCGWKVSAASNVSALDSVIEHVIYVHPLVVEMKSAEMKA